MTEHFRTLFLTLKQRSQNCFQSAKMIEHVRKFPKGHDADAASLSAVLSDLAQVSEWHYC